MIQQLLVGLESIQVKSEPVMFVGTDQDNTGSGLDIIKNANSGDPVGLKDEPDEIYFGTNRGRPNWQWGSRRGYSRGRNWGWKAAWTTSGRAGLAVNNNEGAYNQKKTNPVDANGRIKVCRVCGSKYHFAAKCPDNENVFITDTGGEGREEF